MQDLLSNISVNVIGIGPNSFSIISVLYMSVLKLGHSYNKNNKLTSIWSYFAQQIITRCDHSQSDIYIHNFNINLKGHGNQLVPYG